ncbi:MAG TPA: response regulator [Methanosarcinales archaeon]|nr:response regulator [Methanosarcinales archaeon]
MVVDDEPDVVDLLSLMLESQGYDIITAYGGSECLEKLEHEIPDLILLDLIMPDVDGWEVLDRIRQNERLKSVFVIILTAKQLTAEVVQKKAQYIAEYLVKPVTKGGLISAIENIASYSKELNEFTEAAERSGVDQVTIDRYIELDRQVGTYKRLCTSLIQTFTRRRLKADGSAKNTMDSVKQLISLRERDLMKLHEEIEERIEADR